MSEVENPWFIRHFSTVMPLLTVGVLLGGFTAVAYGIGPAPSAHDALVLYAVLSWMAGCFIVLPRFFMWWAERPL